MDHIQKVEIYTEKIVNTIHILSLSDTHLAYNKGFSHLQKIIENKEINWQDLDYITIVGDLIDKTNDLKKKEFIKLLKNALIKLSKGIPTIFVLGNHELYIEGKYKEWNKDCYKPLLNTIASLENFTILNNDEILTTKDNIVFGALVLDYNYYKTKEKFREYQKQFFKQYKDNKFKEENYNILLTHSSAPLIKLSKKYNMCIQPNTDLVLSGHMHNGMIPNEIIPFIKHHGLVGPKKKLFPAYAHGTHHIGNTDFIINGPVNSFVKVPIINDFYGTNATILTLKRKKD